MPCWTRWADTQLSALFWGGPPRGRRFLCRGQPSGTASTLPRRKFLRAPTTSNSPSRTAAADRLRRQRQPRRPRSPPASPPARPRKLDSVKLTENGDKKAPGVEFTKPLEVKEPTVKVVTEGNGDRVKANQIADISIVAFNGKDGSTLEDTFAERSRAARAERRAQDRQRRHLQRLRRRQGRLPAGPGRPGHRPPAPRAPQPSRRSCWSSRCSPPRTPPRSWTSPRATP